MNRSRIAITCALLGGLMGCDGDGPTAPVFPEFGDIRTAGDHREMDVRFISRGVALAGTIYFPPSGEGFPGVAVTQGSSWEGRATWQEVSGPSLGLGSAILSYDKRGFGESEGTFFLDADVEAFDILSDDLVAAAETLANAPLVRADRVGVIGTSQGGWVVPLTANKAPGAITFAIIAVGGAVSSGQEGLYDELTGYDVCQRTATPLDEINDELRRVGPSGFDPEASLRAMTQPTMWLFGGQDFSHPTQFSIEQLDKIQAEQPKDWTIVVLENANHDLIEGGSICQSTGTPADALTPWLAWYTQLFGDESTPPPTPSPTSSAGGR